MQLSEARTRSHILDEPLAVGGTRMLAIWPGGSSSQTLSTAAAALRVGRSATGDLRIDHDSVSRLHVTMHVGAASADGERSFVVEDMGGSNGTRINGRRIAACSRIELSPGDIVELGGAVLLVQRAEATAEPVPAASSRDVGVTSHGFAPPPPERSTIKPPVPPPFGTPSSPIVESPAMKRLYRTLDLLASSRINVLVVGETGVGKELAARALHERSPRASGPFVPLNCASMPDNLLESELFGFEKGAFTGADRAKAGLLEAANGGTLLLDEIGEMPLPTQAKLLRVLEQREVWRVGALSGRSIDVRFVAATHRSLRAMADQGLFRRDLYYRLNGLHVEVPPLRERTDEIAPLALRFVTDTAAEHGWAPPAILPSTMAALLQHQWPGNVRELRNAMERAATLSQGHPIEVFHLGLESAPALPTGTDAPANHGASPRSLEASPQPVEGKPLQDALSELERNRIVEALETTGGNQTRAAELLGMSRRTLVKRLGEYSLPRPRKPKA